MSTAFEQVLSSPPSGRSVPLIIDHASYGSARILHGAPVPWADPVKCQNYFGQAQGLLRPDLTLVDVGAAYSQQLAQRPELLATMGAQSRPGYAVRTLLADEAIAESVRGLVDVLGSASRLHLALQVPSPLRWLALAQVAAGQPDLTAIEPEHGESAAKYLADWLRRFETCPVALLVLDGRRTDDPRLDGLSVDDLSMYSPLINAVDHYRWGLALRTDVALALHGHKHGALVPPSFWVNGDAPVADILLTEIPGDAEPELVLDRLAALG